MADQIKWEYQVISVGSFLGGPNDRRLEEQLNEMGIEGWEVVAFTQRENTGKMTFIAKRPLAPSTSRQRSLPSY